MTDGGREPADLIRAAGALVWRGSPDAPEVALVHRPAYDDWSFPKGKLKRGEHPVAAALREVTEETGLTVELGRSLPSSRYIHRGRPKRVDHWVARMVAEGPFTAGDEVDEVVWLPVEEAGRRLSYGADAELLRAFGTLSPATTPLVLVRHALAGNRREWKGDDDERPLDKNGRRQAGTLAAVLGAFAPAELVSSPSERCVRTLQPYAERSGLPVRLEPALSESRYDPGACLRLAEDALASGRSVALCSHGKILPELISGIEGLAGGGSVRLGSGGAGDGRPGGCLGEGKLRKGAFMVLHHAGGHVVAADAYPT
ncbi:NUDIX hydrolase [Streptosporangium sp. NPDC023615]|uniref:NUDIX hydrolase n=1 Tax=Streptosporangium sp. NPDC023615 TaxID=3154794 RepID=UPI0034196F0F